MAKHTPVLNWLLANGYCLVLGGALCSEGRGREEVAVVGALRLDGGAGLEPTGQVAAVADEHRGVSARDTEDVGQRRLAVRNRADDRALQAHRLPVEAGTVPQQLSRRDHGLHRGVEAGDDEVDEGHDDDQPAHGEAPLRPARAPPCQLLERGAVAGYSLVTTKSCRQSVLHNLARGDTGTAAQ